MRDHIQTIVDGLLDGVASAGTMDLIHDFAEPLPAVVIAERLGVPPGDHRQFREWSSQVISGLPARTMEERRTAGAPAVEAIFEYLGE